MTAHTADVFVGGVCTGAPGVSPVAFVYRFAGGAYSPAPVLTQDMGYARTGGSFGPWGSGQSEPMLTGLSFVGEDLVLAFRARDTPLQGEILRACQNTPTSWTVESNGTATCPFSA